MKITMEARLVESFRGDWSPLGEELHDPEVARDFVVSLEPTHGPAVVRVSAAGGPGRAASALRGDWLCDPRTPAANRKVPPLPWDRAAGSSAAAWSAGMQAVEAWESCPSHVWMLRVAAFMRLSRRLVFAAQCACLRDFMRAARLRGDGSEGDFDASGLEESERWAWAGVGRPPAPATDFRLPAGGDEREASYAEAARRTAAAIPARRPAASNAINYGAALPLAACGYPEAELAASVRRAIQLVWVLRSSALRWHAQSASSRGGSGR